MTTSWPRRFESVPAFTNTVEDFVADFCSIDGNISANTIKLRGCSFSGSFSLTTVGALTCDLESFKNLIAATTNVTGVASFVANFPRFGLAYGAAVATSGQYLVGGTPNVNSTATEGQATYEAANSYVLLGLRGRSLTNSCTLTVRIASATPSPTLNCSPAANGDANDYAIAHWLKGNATDQISVLVGGTAGGLVRAVVEGVYL